MDDSTIDMILSNCDFPEDLKDFYMFLQIQMYEAGDYIVPHRDNYTVKKLHLVTLTTSDCDALIMQRGDNLIRFPDVAGQKVEENFNDFHWVDPVRDLRFTLVIGE
jgi:Rps23 Pro-64 3,4-dihydroxylase Tpa1-like proline 4-hydroxylase